MWCLYTFLALLTLLACYIVWITIDEIRFGRERRDMVYKYMMSGAAKMRRKVKAAELMDALKLANLGCSKPIFFNMMARMEEDGIVKHFDDIESLAVDEEEFKLRRRWYILSED